MHYKPLGTNGNYCDLRAIAKATPDRHSGKSAAAALMAEARSELDKEIAHLPSATRDSISDVLHSTCVDNSDDEAKTQSLAKQGFVLSMSKKKPGRYFRVATPK